MKVCGKCKTEKALKDFTKSKARKDGLNWHCNLGLGIFQDSLELLHKAAKYLEKHKQKPNKESK